MLPKKNRISRKDFVLLKNSRPKFSGKFFSMIVVEGKTTDCSKFAFLISRKVSTKAVLRNKIKRMLNESVKKYLGDIKEKHLILFITKKDIVVANNEEISLEVEKSLKEVKLIK